MNLDAVLQTFIIESRELLDDMEAALLAAGPGPEQAERVNAMFRAAHTIKGAAGLFGLEPIVAFTHQLESLLDRVRDGTVALGEELVALLLSCGDHIGGLIGELEAGRGEPDAATLARGAPLLAQLLAWQGGPAAAPPLPAPLADPLERLAGAACETDTWHLSLRFGGEVLRDGMDPIAFLRYLGRLGTIVGIATLSEAMPAPEAMDPEQCYLGFEIAFQSAADKATIEGVFEFVRDDCQLRMVPPQSRLSDYVALIEALPEDSARLGELLVRCGSVTAHELSAALAQQSARSGDAPALGGILVERGAVAPVVVDAALAKQERAREARSLESRSIRVDADKLDQLINLIGELTIAGASAHLIGRRAQHAELRECTAQLAALVEAVRDGALQLRMVRIGATFNRFQRVVHDVARETGKQIALRVSGEETELDKTVVEKIGDPLTHLVRNAIDHGIEAASLRAERGKPATGTVRLDAYHDSGCIVIEVSDDGGGLRRDRILAKAQARGLVEPGRVLSDSEIYALVFEPGFSTAEQVTNLSGRGVGMDVVKRNITALRGTVGITSSEGVGTTVTVRLPLTLAIINGFLVGLGRRMFVVPLDLIEECVAFSATPGHDYTNLRGEVLPLIRLRAVFGIDGAQQRRESIVVVRVAGRKIGLVVDALHGEFQTVIKPLNKMFSRVRCISGSTILGTGEVALIVDVPALIAHADAPPPVTTVTPPLPALH